MDYDHPKNSVFTVQERHLESEEELFGLGFNPLNSEYYHVSNQGDELPWDPTLAKEFTFYMHPDVVYQKRAVFTFFDALGDIGGLRDIFTVVGQFLVTIYGFVFGSHLD